MDLITPLLDWISQNPTWAGLFVMLTALFESLALVGLFLPGAAMMFGIGALVGTGHMALWPTLAWAAAGAIAGDGISFWLGRHFHQQIKVIWPFRTHPELMARSIDFFYRHGGKSILLGRFVGPIRPVIPAVAGMLEMPPSRFFIVNVISGLLWAPVYVLPGMVFASSIGLAAEAATRLAILGGMLLVFILLFVWLLRLSFDWVHHHTFVPMRALLEWSRLHPVMGKMPAAILDPQHPEARGLTLLALLLILAALGLLVLMQFIGVDGLLSNLNQYIHHTLQNLRSPFMDYLMVMITELGDTLVLTSVFSVILVWLLWQHRWQAAGHWAAAAGFALVLTQSLKLSTHVLRPIGLYEGASAFSFPSGHTSLSMVIYGFLAVLIAHELSYQMRKIVYAVTGILILTIGFSRLYLGAHWFTDVMGGILFGMVWVALLGIAYRSHPSLSLPVRGLITATGLSLLLSAGWNHASHFEGDLQRYALDRTTSELTINQWWEEHWQKLPAYRSDLRGYHDHPLTLQYAGSLPGFEQLLLERGWQRPEKVNGVSWLKWLNRESTIIDLPVLPQVHDGRNESLLLVRKLDDPKQMAALRLWQTDIRLQPGNTLLWIGNVTLLQLPEAAKGVNVPKTNGKFDAAYQLLKHQLEKIPGSLLQQRQQHRTDGRFLLLLKAEEGRYHDKI
jgi:membrane protein DedA with SNARE-associated domain/membrane-associated phospholipid phosphatase